MTKDILYCGVTSDSLLTNKAYANLIEPYNIRAGRVRDFLKRLAPHLKVEISELNDATGVGGVLSDLQACVLTKETEKGGHMVNQKRRENGLEPL